MRAPLGYLGRHHIGLLALLIALRGHGVRRGAGSRQRRTTQLKNGAVSAKTIKSGR